MAEFTDPNVYGGHMSEEQQANRIAANGRTYKEQQELGYQQKAKTMPMVDCNNAKPEDFQDEYFKKQFANHKIGADIKHRYIVAMEVRSFNQQSGVKISQAQVQSFDEKNFEMMKKLVLPAQTTHILHYPEAPYRPTEDGTDLNEGVEVPKQKAIEKEEPQFELSVEESKSLAGSLFGGKKK